MELIQYLTIKHRLQRGERDIASIDQLKEIFSILDCHRDLARRMHYYFTTSSQTLRDPNLEAFINELDMLLRSLA